MSAYRPRQHLDQPFGRPISEHDLGRAVAQRMLARRGPFTVRRRPPGGTFHLIADHLTKTQARHTTIEQARQASRGAVVEVANLFGWMLRLKVVSDLVVLRDEAADTIRLARSQLLAPYVFATINPVGPEGGPGSGFDCSGLFVWTFGEVGIILPHSANQIMHNPQIIRFANPDQLRVGDFIFSWFPNDRGLDPSEASHITQFIGGGHQIGSQPSTHGVEVIPLYGAGPDIGYGHIRGVTAPEAA